MQTDHIPSGYKLTEVGIIPSDWDVVKLENVALSISSGKSQLKSKFGKYPVYGSTGIIGYYNNYDYEGKKILVARVGANAGKINFVEGKYCISDNTLVIDLTLNSDINFFKYKLEQFNLNSLTFGSGQPLITGNQLKNLLIPLPPIEEQKRIAQVLSDIDELIRSLDELIIKKRNIKQGTMQLLLTGKQRLSGYSGEWEVKKLQDISEKIMVGIASAATHAYRTHLVSFVITVATKRFDPKLGFSIKIFTM